MKYISTFLLTLIVLNLCYSQCVSDFDFGDTEFGISPDFSIGESLEVGYIGEDYYDVIHMLLPQFAADVDSTLPIPETLELDSIELVSITMSELANPEIIFTPEELGLEIICNNNGDSNNSCSFLGSSQYCASVEGVPNTSGEYMCTITILGWVNVLGFPFAEEAAFDGITLEILEANNDYGCTDPEACNYNQDAIFDDGSCVYECQGCTDTNACNYDETAEIDDGSCDYSCYGCIDPEANNYNPYATIDDESCCYLQIEVEVADAPCNGEQGSIEVEIVNADPAVDVVFNIDGAEYIIDNLYEATAGNYTVNASLDIDSFGCATSIEIEINEPEILTIEAYATDASVIGNGIGTTTVTGGTPDYTIVWMNADDNSTVDENSLVEGNYIVSVIDANYCEAETTVSVVWNSIKDLHPVDFNIFPNPSNGELTITSSNFMKNSTVKIIDRAGRILINTDTYNLNNGLSLDLNHLVSGMYSIVVEDENERGVHQIQLIK